jgi:acetyltransferase-like isoleucine patch superfamily enzyme
VAFRNKENRQLRGLSHQGRLRLCGAPMISGPLSRARISPTAGLSNVMINTIGGSVEIGDFVLFGHDVLLLTGTHNFRETGQRRQVNRPTKDRNILIEAGVWIASRAVIIGPCRIGKNSVIGCGCVVDFDVPPDTVVRVRQELVQEPIRYSEDTRRAIQ